MPPVLRRLRQQMPYLTPPGFFPDDEDERLRLPRLQPSDEADIDKIFRLGGPPTVTPREQVPALNRPVLVPPPETSAMLPPPVADNFTVGPPRVTDAQLAEAGAPPMVLRRDGRPTTKFIGEGTPEERLGVRRRALEEYEPQKESKKALALRTLLSFVGGGLVGRGGVAETLLGPGGVLDRRGKDRAWQQEQLGQVDEQYGRLSRDRRAGLQDRLLQSQVTENEADAAAKMRPPPIKDVEISGGYMIRPNTSGGYDTVYSPPQKPSADRDPLRETVTLPDGSTKVVLSFDRGKTWQDVPELQGAPKPTNDPPPAQIDANIAELERQIAQLGPSPPTEVDETALNYMGKPVVTGKKVNPAYTHWSQKYDEKSRELRDWRAKRRTTPTLTRGSRAGLTIEGAISRWKQVNKHLNREPNETEIARMKAAMGQ